MDMDPSWSPDGRFIVFSSDRTGIFNLYAYEVATEHLYQVTNLLSGAFQPTVSPDGKLVVFTGFTSLGFDAFSAAFDPATWPLAQPFANTRPDAQPVTLESAHAPGERPDAPLVEKITEYHPWRYFYPRNWLLTVPSDPLGLGASLGLQTGVRRPRVQPFGRGQCAGADQRRRVGAGGLHLQRALAVAVAVAHPHRAAGQRPGRRRRRARIHAGPLERERRDLAAGAGQARRVGERLASYLVRASTRPPIACRSPIPPQGIVVAPETGPNAGVSLTFNYSNVKAWPYSISGQAGRRLQLSV